MSDRESWDLLSSDPHGGALLSVSEHSDGDTVTVSLRGDLDMASASDLHDHVTELLQLPVRALVLDLDGVGFLDSAGLASLLWARDHANARGVEFAVVAVPRQARQVMELTDTLSVFDGEHPG